MFGSSGGAIVRPGLGSGVQLYPTNQRPRYFAVTGGEQYRNVDFAILPDALHNLSGKVELPEPGIRFWLALISPDQPGLATAVAETEKDSGAFRFTSVPAGSYVLTAAGPMSGYGGKGITRGEPYFARTQVSIGADVEGVTVTVQKGRAARLILRGAEQSGGACPATAQVAVTAIEDFAVRIDAGGTISAKETEIANLAPARYQVVASGMGDRCYQSSETLLDLTTGVPDAAVPVSIAAAGSIRGKLTGAKRPGDFMVALLAADPEAGAPVQVVIPSSDGSFAFGGLRPGSYRIGAQAGGARWVRDAGRTIEIQIAGGAPTEMDLPAPAEVKQ